MKIALIGYGKMGKTIEQIAIQRGHQIVSIIDINNAEDIYSEAFKSADAAIEFTTPATAFNNYMKCFEVGVPVRTGYYRMAGPYRRSQGEMRERGQNLLLRLQLQHRRKYLLRHEQVSGENHEQLPLLRR